MTGDSSSIRERTTGTGRTVESLIRWAGSVSVILVVVGAVATLAVVGTLFVGGGAADNHGGADDDHGGYAVEQDGQCVPVAPITDEETTAKEFYDYRNPYTDASSYTYSSYGTEEYQRDDTSVLILHEGSDGTSLVVVHDRLHEDRYDGTKGGVASFNVSGLPSDGEWVIEDDDYDDQDDVFVHDETESELHWIWKTGRTDGAAYSSLGDKFAVTIEPGFNEEAHIDPESNGDERSNGTITEWQVISATDDGGYERHSLPSLSESAVVRTGSCADDDAPDAALAVPDTVVADETVVLDASDSNVSSEDVTYEWRVDGKTVERAGDPLYEFTATESGDLDVGVTVTDAKGRSDDATATVDVAPPLNADVSVDADAVAVGEPVAFDASGSGGDVETHEWAFGDGEGATGEVITHAYDEPGEYDVELTVRTGNNETDTATETVTVDDAEETDAANETGSTNGTGGALIDGPIDIGGVTEFGVRTALFALVTTTLGMLGVRRVRRRGRF